jgi:hypothetical protein
MRLTHRAGTCDNGPCPNVFDTDEDGMVAIQGALVTDAEALAQVNQMPDHEVLVLVPKELLLEYARAAAAEEVRA